MVDQSILNTVKHNLGINDDQLDFDPTIITYINGVFSQLNQLGIGPEDGFMIEDDSAVWADFIGTNKKYNFVKTYISLKVHLMFDPPSTAYWAQSMKEQIAELEWRLSVLRESTEWVNPNSIPTGDEDLVLDGGQP